MAKNGPDPPKVHVDEVELMTEEDAIKMEEVRSPVRGRVLDDEPDELAFDDEGGDEVQH